MTLRFVLLRDLCCNVFQEEVDAIDFEYPATDHKTTVLRALKRMKPLLITGTSGFVSDIEFDVLKKDVLGLKKIYFTVDVNNIDPRSEYVRAYSQIWIRFNFDAVYDTKNSTLISIDFNDLRNGNDDCWMCGGCDDDEDYDDTSDEQIKDIIKALDVDPNQMSLF